MRGPLCLALGLVVALSGCDQTVAEFPGPVPVGPQPVEQIFRFADGADGWVGDFADLPADATAEFYELAFEHRKIPPETQRGGMTLFLAGHNHSDDLFMFVKRQFTGLVPGQAYDVHVQTELASDAPSGCFGVGGAPGESVYLKVGASEREPLLVVDDLGWLRLSVDKGQQAADGAEAIVVGTIANGLPCDGSAGGYQIIRRDTETAAVLDEFGNPVPGEDGEPQIKAPIAVVADASGAAWVFLGTDSGFEGRTALYYDYVRVRFEPKE